MELATKPKCQECGHVHWNRDRKGRCPDCACTIVLVEDLDADGLQQLADMGVEVPGFKARLQ